MLINEIAQKTGISKKAIYIYESKGLLNVHRRANRYREYTEDDELRLNKIKLLRLAGISIADIKMLFDRVITVNELTRKRKKEIEKEFGSHSEQLSLCSKILDSYKNKEYGEYEFSETDFESTSGINEGDILSLGIDIGTTTISAAVINITQSCQAEFFTIPNNSAVKNDGVFSEQDPEQIFKKVEKLANSVISSFDNIKSIGITGQMHGILYLDEEGNAASPFVTWQDKRGDIIICGSDETYCEKLKRITGRSVSTGFGFATHFYNSENGNIPQNACTFCNITDYAAMRLCGINKPVIHSSIAASFGLFDIAENRFESEKIKLFEKNNISLPNVTDSFYICGYFKGIPVSSAIGDNQASFFGSVENPDESVLVNIGTGSQISMIETGNPNTSAELRPLCKGKFISCGSALCGGQSFALTEKFFREFVKESGGSDAAVYNVMNSLAEKAFFSGTAAPEVKTTFRGTRTDPDLTASVTRLTDKNFTAGQLILGVVYGICRELYDFLDTSGKKTVIASGNAVQKNSIFGTVLKDVFKKPIKITQLSEEAATGAALFSAVSAGMLNGINDFGKFIKYREV